MLLIKLTLKLKLFVIIIALFSSTLILINTKKVFAQDSFFYDNFDTFRETWEEHGEWAVIDGEYKGTATNYSPLNPSYTIGGNRYWGDYTFKVKIKGVQGHDKVITFRVDENGRYYGLNIISLSGSSGNIIDLSKGPKIGGTTAEPLKQVDFPNAPGVWYELRVDVKNEEEEVLIKLYIDNILRLEFVDVNNPILHGAIALFVWPGGGGAPTGDGYLVTSTLYDDIYVTNYMSEIPLPTPTPPTSKVVVIPGMGGSWNTEAILNCDLDGSYEWDMSPFATAIYQPLVDELNNNGWETLPFYYDWRKNITNNADVLDNFISNNTVDNEKVDLVGHSMGGLVGRGYMEETKEKNKIEKYISVGSPHKGVVLAYTAWAGGDVWNDNILTRIAINTLINRCGGPFSNKMMALRNIAPSIQDLLPTFDYLTDKKSKKIKKVSEINIQNNWLDGYSFAPPYWDTQVITLSGVGNNTLENIFVKNPSRREKALGLWEDGKPVNKEETQDGDGTVLSKSSQLDGAENELINQTHIGLINSGEGIDKILEFLGTLSVSLLRSTASETQYEEPKSALIFLSSDATFSLIDPQGKLANDENGTIGILNPKSGNYILNIFPKQKKASVLVGQFYQNGETTWSEYKIRRPSIKTLKFYDKTNRDNKDDDDDDNGLRFPLTFPKFDKYR